MVLVVKNPPAKAGDRRDPGVRSLGWEDPLEEEMATHSSVLAWKIPVDRGAWQAIVHRVTKSWTQLSDQYFHYFSWITLGNNMKSIDLHPGL